VRVSVDFFMANLQMFYQGDLGLNEALARQSADDRNYQRRWVRRGGYADYYHYSTAEIGDDRVATTIDTTRVYFGQWQTTAVSQNPSLAWLLGVKSQKAQTTLIEDDPKTISSQGSNNCQFTISFESGTFYEGNRNLSNGPGEIQYKGRTYLGLGFTVSGTTRGGGGIGRIGSQVNPDNPTGQWTLDQYTSNYAKQNGEFVTIGGRSQQGGEAWQDIDLTGFHFATNWTNRFSRYDHPSLAAGVPNTYKNQAFLIKVFRGKEVCQAEFHIIQRGDVIHWGRGGQGVWPN